MKQTLKLTSIYFKEQLIGLFGGSNKKGRKNALLVIILLSVLIAAGMGFELFSMGRIFKQLNKQEFILIIGLMLGVFLSLMTTVNDTQGIMYGGKDYDMLASLPIKTSSIISAKFFSIYLISTLYYSLIGIPTFVVYFIFNPITFLGILFGLISLLVMPAFGQLISCILGWFINLISAKMNNKNIIKTVLSIILAVGLFVFMSLANTEVFGNMFAEELPLWFKIVFSNIYFLFTSVTKSNGLYFLYCVLINFAFIALAVTLIATNYKKINSYLKTTKTKLKQKPIEYKTKSVFSRLLSKEFVTLFNYPVYCVNCMMGIIMTFVVSIIYVIMYFKIGEIPEVQIIMTGLMVFTSSMCMGIAPTTSCSTSMEGSKFQVIKSMPIGYKDYAYSKCVTNLILYMPTVIISSVIFAVAVKLNILWFLLVIGYLLVVSYTQTLLGFILNLKFPRLSWTNETQACKNGASLVLTMVIDMLTSILPAVLFILGFMYIEWLTLPMFIGVFLGLQIIYAIVLTVMCFNKGEEMFNNIQP